MTTQTITTATMPLLNPAALPGLEELREESDSLMDDIGALAPVLCDLRTRVGAFLRRSDELEQVAKRLLLAQIDDEDEAYITTPDRVDAVMAIVGQMTGAENVHRMMEIAKDRLDTDGAQRHQAEEVGE